MNMDLQQFSELKTNITLFVNPIRELKVIDKDSSSNASKTFNDVRAWKKKIEDKRKEIIAPLRAQIDRINEFAEQIAEPLNDAEGYLKSQLVAFEKILEEERKAAAAVEREQQRKREEEARIAIQKQQEEAAIKARELKEQAEMEAMFSAPDDAEETKKLAEKESLRLKAEADAESARIAFESKKEHWDAKKEIATNKVAGTRRTWKFEVTDESLVPMEYKTMIINDKKLKFAVVTDKIRSIPGVHIYEDISITTRS